MGTHFGIATETESQSRHCWRCACGARLLSVAVLCAVFAAGVFVEQAQSAEFQTLSAQQIVGGDAGTQTAFSAVYRESQVEIRIDLPDRKSILAVVNYETESLVLKSVATGTDNPAKIDAADVARMEALRLSVGRPGHRIGQTLSTLIELMSEAPAGVVIDVDTTREQRGAQPRAYDSLCGATSATGHYDANGTDFTVPVPDFGCYTEENECLGRCGTNCGDDPGNVAAVQRLTQSCLDHDLCAHATDENLGPCSDEFAAASDDFFFAPDCGSLTGTWRNGAGRAMTLIQDDDQDLSGRVATEFGECRYRIRAGEHIEEKFRLSSRIIESTPGCCPRLTYRGSIARSCNAARVRWSDSCGAEGSTSFRRR